MNELESLRIAYHWQGSKSHKLSTHVKQRAYLPETTFELGFDARLLGPSNLLRVGENRIITY
jgi:hypothetical protein